MPGHNHYPSCSCGWCSGSAGRRSRGQSRLNINPFSTYIRIEKVTKIVSKPSQTDEARTYLTECWWCGATVYYHSNGYGDSVLFDSLGVPWEIHSCWESYREEKKEPKIFDLKVEQFKCLVLAGAIRKLQTDRKIPTEQNIAIEMGISVEELQSHYQDFYVVVSPTDGRIQLQKKDLQKLDL